MPGGRSPGLRWLGWWRGGRSSPHAAPQTEKAAPSTTMESQGHRRLRLDSNTPLPSLRSGTLMGSLCPYCIGQNSHRSTPDSRTGERTPPLKEGRCRPWHSGLCPPMPVPCHPPGGFLHSNSLLLSTSGPFSPWGLFSPGCSQGGFSGWAQCEPSPSAGVQLALRGVAPPAVKEQRTMRGS